MLDEQRMERNKKRLQEERTRLMAEIRSVSAAMDEGERPGLGTHMADSATEVFEQTKNLAVNQRLRSTLEQVNRALEKIDRGTYRVCDQCGGPIDPARLKALPYATYCKSCQARLELATRSR